MAAAVIEPGTGASPEAFGALFEQHSRAIYSYCFRRTGDWALAEDLTSTVFLEAWRPRDDADLDTRPALPWLYGVATNVLRNQRRSLRRHKAALERVPRPRAEDVVADEAIGRADAEAQMRELLTAVRGLNEGEREVVALCIWCEQSYEDAAQALDIPVGTVRSRLARARERLEATRAR